MWVNRNEYENILDRLGEVESEKLLLQREVDDLRSRNVEMASRLDIIVLAASPKSGFAHDCSDVEGCLTTIVPQ